MCGRFPNRSFRQKFCQLCLGWVASVVCSGSLPAVAQSIVADDARLELISDDFRFTEGPAVDPAGDIYFTDQPNDRILKLDVQERELTTWLQPAGRSNGLFFDASGNLIACADGKNELWRIHPDKTHKVLLSGYEGKLLNGPNDVWVAADDSLYFTDPYYKREYWQRDPLEPQLPRRVYYLSPDRQQVRIAAEDFKQPNGIVGDWKRRLLFVADIGDNKTYRFKIDAEGQLTNRTVFCRQGSDGMTLDQDGNLYLTGKGVMVYDANGQYRETIEVPEGWTANVVFGGKQRDVLFITASDSLYAIKTRVRGL